MIALIIGTIFAGLIIICDIWEIITIKEVSIFSYRIEIIEKLMWMLFAMGLLWYYCRLYNV